MAVSEIVETDNNYIDVIAFVCGSLFMIPDMDGEKTKQIRPRVMHSWGVCRRCFNLPSLASRRVSERDDLCFGGSSNYCDLQD